MTEIPHIVRSIAFLKPKPGNTNTDIEPPSSFSTPITEAAAEHAALMSQSNHLANLLTP